MGSSKQVTAARAYLGVKFRHRGRGPHGLDCSGLVVRAYADAGVEVHDYRLYGPEPFRDGLVHHCTLAFGEPIKIAPVTSGDLQDGDVVLMRYDVEPHHMGLVAAVEYAGQPAFNIVHAEGHAGRVLEQRLSDDMMARITHLFRRPV